MSDVIATGFILNRRSSSTISECSDGPGRSRSLSDKSCLFHHAGCIHHNATFGVPAQLKDWMSFQEVTWVLRGLHLFSKVLIYP